MSPHPEEPLPTWIVVLPPSVSVPDLERLSTEFEQRGWSSSSSRSDEQGIFAVQGPRDPRELRDLLAGRCEADVLPILDRGAYRRRRARRRFQSALVMGLGLLSLGALVIPLVGFLQPPPGTLFSPDLVRVARAGEIAVGEPRIVRLSEKPVLVMRLAPERWCAVSASCTFMEGCRLQWDAERGQLLCPCHGCAFDVHGNVLHPPASLPLVRREVLQDGDAVFLRRTW